MLSPLTPSQPHRIYRHSAAGAEKGVSAETLGVADQVTLSSAPQSSAVEDLTELLRSSLGPIPSARFYIFGATGDLVSKRSVRDALVELAETDRLNPEQHALIMMGSKPSSGAAYLERFRQGDADSKPIREAGFEKFRALTSLQEEGASVLGVNLTRPEDFQQIQHDVGSENAVFLAAVPPKAYKPLLDNLKSSGLSQSPENGAFRRILLEKPFGANSTEARELAEVVERDFEPGQVLLIDHFLGYPGMSHMLQFKARPEVDEALRSQYVERVEVKLLETIKSNDRPYFRDTGILKDMTQNHAMQILSSLAMDLPTNITSEQLRLQRQRAAEAVEIVPETVVRGQFSGFNDPLQGAPEGAPPSEAETLVAFDLKVGLPRWEGVRFHLINAKGVEQKRSGVDVHLRALPPALAERLGLRADQPATMKFTVNGKAGIEVVTAEKTVSVPLDPQIPNQAAYAGLLASAAQGESAFFATPAEAVAGWRVSDAVEAAWAEKPVVYYTAGTAHDQIGNPSGGNTDF